MTRARPRSDRRAGPRGYFERDLDEVADRLPPERDEPEREPLARVEPERLEDEADREEPDFAEPERPEDDPERERVDDDDERERLEAEPERELLDRLDELLDPFDDLRARLDDERRARERDVPFRRSAAGISSLATALASCAICFSRNLAIRSSSRRMPRASFAVSLSFTASASASMPL